MNEISFSVIIDKPKKCGSITNLISINDSNVNWSKDELINECESCKKEFSLLLRKHHCRYCGNIFCSKCSNFWIKLPIKNKHKQSYNLYSYYKFFNENKERVCKKCYSKIYECKELMYIINIFDLVPLTLLDYLQMKLVCKSWYKISNFYISNFKKIQFSLPNHIYTEKEKTILYNNRFILSGHSIWLIKLISNFTNEDIEYILNKPKKHSCSVLRCKLNCNDKMNPEEIIQCLYQKINNPKIIKILLDELLKTDIHEIIPYLSILVFIIRYYRKYILIVSEFVNFLIKKSSKSIELSNLLFWELTLSSKDVEYQNFYMSIRKKLVNNLDKEQYNLFLNGYDFTQNIIELINSSDEPVISLKKHLKNNKYKIDNYFTLPINIKKKFHEIDIEKIKTINSKTKPVILPCKYLENEVEKTFRIMIKKDDIRKEAIVMNIIKLMDFFLKKDENLDLNIITYNILPVSNQYGYIEFVSDSYTLYNIKEDRHFSIQNFIMEKNPHITAHQLRENFTKSCAAYCVITYLLGIGDRHLDNIMITKDAYIFNIDFGYIMGKDPKIMSPEFRLTTEMIDAMGGTESIYYKNFKNYCYIAYNCLRKHTSIFTILLSLLYSLNPKIKHLNLDEDYIKYQIKERFIPDENYENAKFYFKYKISKNENNYTGNIIDYFHKKNKSFSESNSNSDLMDSAVKFTNSVKNTITSKFKKMFWN